MGRYTGKTCRLLTMLILTASFFLVEIIVGYITNSLALVGDSYHMLSDVISLLVGFASVRIAKWSSQKNTFGWARAEVLGALVNAVFLMALCFTIFVEAIQRLFHDEHIHDPELMLIVGSIGLAINLVGLFLFHGHVHGHSHGGHGHDGHGHSHSSKTRANGDIDHSEEIERLKKSSPRSSSFNCDAGTPDGEGVMEVSKDVEEEDRLSLHTSVAPKMVSGAQLNMKGVFLHVLGDALGSIIVIISALIIKYADGDWRYKVDPAMSMVMVIIIFSTTVPLLKESALILLQTVPTHIQVGDLKERLISKVEGVIAIHEFHIWQLAGNRIIASAHIHCRNLRDYMRIAEDVKTFFHNAGIHSTTIQPEFIEEPLSPQRPLPCLFPCPEQWCQVMTCCDEPVVRRRSQQDGDRAHALSVTSVCTCNSNSLYPALQAQACFDDSCLDEDMLNQSAGSLVWMKRKKTRSSSAEGLPFYNVPAAGYPLNDDSIREVHC